MFQAAFWAGSSHRHFWLLEAGGSLASELTSQLLTVVRRVTLLEP